MEAGVLWREEVQIIKDKDYKTLNLIICSRQLCNATFKKPKTI